MKIVMTTALTFRALISNDGIPICDLIRRTDGLTQEAQLPLKNRALATHFFVAKLLSIAVMTYSYVYHLQNVRAMIRLICYAHREQTSARDSSTYA